jgi:hypothetical protein
LSSSNDGQLHLTFNVGVQTHDRAVATNGADGVSNDLLAIDGDTSLR